MKGNAETARRRSIVRRTRARATVSGRILECLSKCTRSVRANSTRLENRRSSYPRAQSERPAHRVRFARVIPYAQHPVHQVLVRRDPPRLGFEPARSGTHHRRLARVAEFRHERVIDERDETEHQSTKRRRRRARALSRLHRDARRERDRRADRFGVGIRTRDVREGVERLRASHDASRGSRRVDSPDVLFAPPCSPPRRTVPRGYSPGTVPTPRRGTGGTKPRVTPRAIETRRRARRAPRERSPREDAPRTEAPRASRARAPNRETRTRTHSRTVDATIHLPISHRHHLRGNLGPAPRTERGGGAGEASSRRRRRRATRRRRYFPGAEEDSEESEAAPTRPVHPANSVDPANPVDPVDTDTGASSSRSSGNANSRNARRASRAMGWSRAHRGGDSLKRGRKGKSSVSREFNRRHRLRRGDDVLAVVMGATRERDRRAKHAEKRGSNRVWIHRGDAAGRRRNPERGTPFVRNLRRFTRLRERRRRRAVAKRRGRVQARVAMRVMSDGANIADGARVARRTRAAAPDGSTRLERRQKPKETRDTSHAARIDASMNAASIGYAVRRGTRARRGERRHRAKTRRVGRGCRGIEWEDVDARRDWRSPLHFGASRRHSRRRHRSRRARRDPRGIRPR